VRPLQTASPPQPEIYYSYLQLESVTNTAGPVVGLGGGPAAMRSLESLLYGVTIRDPLSYVAAAGALLIVVLCACAAPALRVSSRWDANASRVSEAPRRHTETRRSATHRGTKIELPKVSR